MEFRRIENLPPYVFTIINNLKIEARRAGRDVIDLGFGNPDIPSPDIAVQKLAEAATSRQPPLLAVAWPAEAARGDRRLLPEDVGRRARHRARDHQHDRLQGGLQPPDVGAARPRRRGDRAEPELPDPHLRPAVRRRRPAPGADALARPSRGARGLRRGVLRPPHHGLRHRLAEAAGARALVPAQPDRRRRRAAVHAARRRLLPRAGDDRRPRLRLRRRRLRRLPAAEHPPGRGGQGVRRRAVLDDEELLDGRLALRLPARQRRGRAGARQAEELPRLRHVPAGADRRHGDDQRGGRLPRRRSARSTRAGATR